MFKVVIDVAKAVGIDVVKTALNARSSAIARSGLRQCRSAVTALTAGSVQRKFSVTSSHLFSVKHHVQPYNPTMTGCQPSIHDRQCLSVNRLQQNLKQLIDGIGEDGRYLIWSESSNRSRIVMPIEEAHELCFLLQVAGLDAEIKNVPGIHDERDTYLLVGASMTVSMRAILLESINRDFDTFVNKLFELSPAELVTRTMSR